MPSGKKTPEKLQEKSCTKPGFFLYDCKKQYQEKVYAHGGDGIRRKFYRKAGCFPYVVPDNFIMFELPNILNPVHA
jgi:hypothetical protein